MRELRAIVCRVYLAIKTADFLSAWPEKGHNSLKVQLAKAKRIKTAVKAVKNVVDDISCFDAF